MDWVADQERFVPARSGRPRRLLLLSAIGAVHVLVILWLVTVAPVEPAPSPRTEALVLIALSPSQTSPEERRVTPVAVTTPPPIPMPSPVPAATARMTLSADQGGGGCRIETQAAAAILQDPAALAELANLPAGLRTEADAVMLWNGAWLGETGLPDPSTVAPVAGELRRVVETTVAAAPAICRDASGSGPVFVPVFENGRTTMLVVGSGTWRWADLLRPESEAAPAPGPAPGQ